jgi:ferredoxin-like protein FixX
MITDHLFELTSYRIDREPHITVNREVCVSCDHRACVFTCPAGCLRAKSFRSYVVRHICRLDTQP